MSASGGAGGLAAAVGRATRNRAGRSFVASTSVFVLAAVVVLGLIVTRVAGQQIEEDALDRAASSAALLARSVFAPRLPDPGEDLGPADIAALDRQLLAARGAEPRLGLRVWDRAGRVVYTSGRRATDGRGPGPPAAVRSALDGRSATEVDRRAAGRRVTAAVPVRRQTERAVAGALELQLPYDRIAGDIRERRRRLNATVAATAGLLYLLVLPALVRVGRLVRQQYDPGRMALVRDLRRAMAHDHLKLEYQPIVGAHDRRLRSAEALVRWRDPRRGPMAPGYFVAEVEKGPEIWDLTVHIFRLALRQLRHWRREGLHVRVAVNLPAAVALDERLPGTLATMVAEEGVSPGELELEVTEAAVMQDPGAAGRILETLRECGVRVISIDDFGTGYSSLARLHDLPIDKLKIDRSFVWRMATTGEEAVIRSIIELGHALGMEVIAEGVELEDTATRLAELECNSIQGYLVSPPLPADEFASWCRAVGGTELGPDGGRDPSGPGRTGPDASRDEAAAR